VLQALLRQPNQILGREQLMGTPELDLPERSIDVRIAKLRRRLELDPQRPRIIKTVHGVGYMLLGAVEWC
jgi:DNA-binding response OmpR family regulator